MVCGVSGIVESLSVLSATFSSGAKGKQYGSPWVGIEALSKCGKCGYLVPFAGCPTCPPQIAKCPKCGAPVIVEFMSEAELDIIVADYREKTARDGTLVDLGDFKGGNRTE